MQLSGCHHEEPFRATPVPVRVCAVCLRALAVQNGMEKRLSHAPDKARSNDSD